MNFCNNFILFSMKSCSNRRVPVFLPGMGGIYIRGYNLFNIFLNQSKSLYLLCTIHVKDSVQTSYKVYWVERRLFSEFFGFFITTFIFLLFNKVLSDNLHFISEIFDKFGFSRLIFWIYVSIF